MAKERHVNPNDIRTMKLCHWISRAMFDRLVDVEPDVYIETHAEQPDTVDAHSYVVTKRNGIEIIADGQWQQFVSPGTKLPSDTPQVLVGPREDVITRMRSYGVPERVLPLSEENGQAQRNAVAPVPSNSNRVS